MKAWFCSGSSTSSSAAAGSPRKSVDILSISSSRNTGLFVPAFFRVWMILPGSAPMYVRRWPRISASSRTPPSDRRTNLRPVARAMLLREAGLADAGRPDEAEDRALELLGQRLHREVLEDALLDLLQAVVVLVEDLLGLVDVVALLGLVVPGQRQDPVDVVAHDGRLRARRVHHLELLELLLDLGGGLFAQPLGLELLFDLLDLVLELVALAAPSSFWIACICSLR